MVIHLELGLWSGSALLKDEKAMNPPVSTLKPLTFDPVLALKLRSEHLWQLFITIFNAGSRKLAGGLLHPDEPLVVINGEQYAGVRDVAAHRREYPLATVYQAKPTLGNGASSCVNQRAKQFVCPL